MLIRRLTVPALLAVVVLASCAPAPTPEPRPADVGGRLYFPLMTSASFRWQRTGYGRPPGAIGRDPDLHNRGMWSYTWGLGTCGADVPMVFDGHDLPAPDVLARCAATAPVLLLFNEPEYASQADTDPVIAAKALRYVEQHWPGEIWCCGNLVSHPGWLDRMLTAYRAEYGGTPRLAGVHLHIYVNDGFAVDAPDDGRWLARSQTQLDQYLAMMAKHGVPLRVVVSECCLLGEHSEAAYLSVMDQYHAWLAGVRQVESVVWFSARYAPFDEADLLQPGGGLSVLGERWLELRWE